MKKKICVIALVVLVFTAFVGCASLDRELTDIKSEIGNGLQREIKVYTANGEVIAEYKGKIDIESDNGYVKFDYKGKRYMYYNCFVESIAVK